MTSKEVAALVPCSPQNVRKKTKQAVDVGEESIRIKGKSFGFLMVHNSSGKAYVYKYLDDSTMGKEVFNSDVIKGDGYEQNSSRQVATPVQLGQGGESNLQVTKEVSKGSRGVGSLHRSESMGRGYKESSECENVSEEVSWELDPLLDNEEKVAMAHEKKRVIDEWAKQKGKLKAAAFLEWINAEHICSFKVTQNKLYDWQKAYKKDGFRGLIDRRTSNKKSLIKELGLEEFIVKLIYAQKGQVNMSNIHKLLNQKACMDKRLDISDFLGKKEELISYAVVKKYVNKYLKANKLLLDLIERGEDGAINSHLPALGKSNWAADSINQIVEIDASPFDAMCNYNTLSNNIFHLVKDRFKSQEELTGRLKEWHKRYTIISLRDTYSGVGIYYLAESENSISISRAIAKYIKKFGKPLLIKGDNGKAFLSNYTQKTLDQLNIEYKAVRAYSGWLKPYVEQGFRELQNSFTENLAEYIGHNIVQRQAIEFFYSKKERRLKKGEKTNLRRLRDIEHMSELMDLYVDKFMHNKYLDRLEMSPRQAYEERQSEAVWMDEMSILMALGGREEKTVTKGRISHDGLVYYNIQAMNNTKVKVARNLDDTTKCWVWDNKNNFLGVGTVLDRDSESPATVEESKKAQKIVQKRIKETKKEMEAAREEMVGFAEKVIRESSLETIQSQTSSIPEAVNVEMQKADNLKVSGGMDEAYIEDLKRREKRNQKRPQSIEDIVLRNY